MDIELRPLTDLQPYPHNPRRNDNAVAAVAASIREYGFRQPIVVDSDGVIVAGHTRYKAALKLGLENVPVHVARGLTPEQVRAYRLADNQTASLATWDEDTLIQELLALQSSHYDLACTGFEPAELDRLLASPSPTITDPDSVPEPPPEPITQPGDLWILGNHRLLCADATQADSYERLLQAERVDLLLTDPPYGVAYVGGTAEQLTIANDDLDENHYQAFLTDMLRQVHTVLKPGAPYYLWHADTHGLTVRQALRDAGFALRQCLVWVKNALVLGRQDYHWRHEPCLYGWKDGAAHPWLGGRTQTTVLEYPKPACSADHPTMKPVELFATLIRNSLAPPGIVLDPFAGSGTTLIAAELTGGHARLLELEPRYCDVIVRRWEDATGQTAQKSPRA